MEVELYVKEHNITGLKYFGKHKVCSTSIYEYSGSGSEWSKHLNEHGDDVTTHLVGKWDEKDPELEYAALSISAHFDIVNSNEWANMKPENGHDGGWEYVNSPDFVNPTHSKEHMAMMGVIGQPKAQERMMWLRENEPGWEESRRGAISKTAKEQYKNGRTPAFEGKTHSAKSKCKMKETHKENKHQQGSKNSQYGTMWITNETESKKIPKGNVPDGWRRGRKLKTEK